MATKKTTKKAKKVAKKPAKAAKKLPRTSGAKKATKKTKSKAKRSVGVSRSKKIAKLPAARLAKLKKLVAAGNFDSQEAFDLDYEILEAVSNGVPDDLYRFDDVPERPGKYWAAWWLEGEVNNGGFHQFFLNKGAVVAAMALEFHKERGPKDIAGMLTRAIAEFPNGKLPKDYEGMMAVLVPDDLDEDERFMQALEPMNQEFFEHNGSSLIETRLRYALDHPTEFFA